MTISDAINLARDLEILIGEAVAEFETRTGAIVERIDVPSVIMERVVSGQVAVMRDGHVEINVRLPAIRVMG